jgi:type II secretory pathway pseudopilin PulG
MRKERGAIFLLLVVAIAVVGVTLILAASRLQAQQAANRAAAEQFAYLRKAAAAVEVWYRENLATVDSQDAAPVIDTVLDRAGVNRRFGLSARISNRLMAGNVGFRTLALWIPAAVPDPSTFDVTTGLFTPAPGVRFVTVSGAALQGQAVADTQRAMASVASTLEQYFAARAAAGGTGVGINHFRPDPTCSGAAGQLPCLDDYTVASAINWAGLGLSGLPVADAWGNPLALSNLADSSTAAPPFSMAIRAATPFGTQLTVRAVQPL